MSEKKIYEKFNKFLGQYGEKINEVSSDCYSKLGKEVTENFQENAGFAAMCCAAMVCTSVINNLHAHNEGVSRSSLSEQMFELITSMVEMFEEDEIKMHTDKSIKKLDKH